MANYHFYRNGGWYCKTSSLSNPGPGADVAACKAALAAGQAPRVGGTATPAASTTPAKKAATPAQAPAQPQVARTPLQQRIQKWLDDHDVTNYTINQDNTVDVAGDLNLNGLRFKKLPVTFNKVDGSIYLVSSLLETLEGLPATVPGDLHLNATKLQTTKGMPSQIDGSLDISESVFPTFVGSGLKIIEADLILTKTIIKSFDECPEVGGDIRLENASGFTSLAGMPEAIGGGFYIGGAPRGLDLSGMPTSIADYLQIDVSTRAPMPDINLVGGKVSISGNMVIGKLPQKIDGGLLFMRSTVSAPLENLPTMVDGPVEMGVDLFNSLKGLYKHLKTINGSFTISDAVKMDYSQTPPTSSIEIGPVLGLTRIKGITSINLGGDNRYPSEIQIVLNQVLNGDLDVHEAQERLIDAGFAKQARL